MLKIAVFPVSSGLHIMSEAQHTALYSWHQQQQAKLVTFAGYAMPVQYAGLIAEHTHTRDAAGLFDVSHMGQCVVSGPQAASALESLLPADLTNLPLNQQSYSLLTNTKGGIDDDLIVCRWAEDTFFIVVNAATKAADFARFAALPDCKLRILEQHALIALQGPKARKVLSRINPVVESLRFMSGKFIELLGHRCYVTCSGYTGEDGFEISCENSAAQTLANALINAPEVMPIGLGARDSLRLEAGLCLYGNDIDATTTPTEASLNWAIAKSRRDGGGFTGSEIICTQLQHGAEKRRTGLLLDGRAPARQGSVIIDADGNEVGVVTSGTFSPTLRRPIAMASVQQSALESSLFAVVRGKSLPVTITKLPFVPHRYSR